MSSKKVSEFSKVITNQDLLNYLNSVSINRPTEIQKLSFKAQLNNQDISMQGRTGSGKTLAYLLPLIEKLKKDEQSISHLPASNPRSIIVVPTRELAIQVFKEAKSISHFSKLRVRKIVGGDKGNTLKSTIDSSMDLLVATPSRLLKILKNGELKLGFLKYVILDEADQLLENSFKNVVSELSGFFNNTEISVTLVSASRPKNFSDITADFFPERKIAIIGKGEENLLNHKVQTFNISIEENDKFRYVHKFLEEQNKKNGVIFMGNKSRAQKLYEMICQLNYLQKVFIIHKDLEIKERVETVERFRKSGGVLVATDIFARGIDISHLQWILNFDLPSEPDYYLHRTGRVGRAGRSGYVFNFITSRDKNRLSRINETLAIQGRIDLKIGKKR